MALMNSSRAVSIKIRVVIQRDERLEGSKNVNRRHGIEILSRDDRVNRRETTHEAPIHRRFT